MKAPLPVHKTFSPDLVDLSDILSRLLAEIPSDIFIIDEQGRPIFCNESFIETLNLNGRDIEQAVGEYVQLEQELFAQVIEGVIKRRETIVVPAYEVTRSGGEKRIYQITLQPFDYQSNGTLQQAILATSVDITAQKKAAELVEQHAHEIELLHNAGQKISETLDLTVIYQTFLDLVSRTMPHDNLFVSSFNAQEEMIYCKYVLVDGVEVDISKLPPIPLEPEGQGLQSNVIRSGKPLLINDVEEYVKHLSRVHYIDENDDVYEKNEKLPDDVPVAQSALIVPLILSGESVGAIQVFSYQKDAFSESDLRLMQALASQIAVASNNALLYEQAQQEIAERKKLQAELEEERNLLAQRVQERTAELTAANEELQQALRIKDEFLANMSHELRTPLNAILGMRESMSLGTYGPLDPRQKKPLTYIQQSGEHLLALINDVLDLSKIQAGQVKAEPVQLSLDKMVREVMDLVADMARRSDITLNFSSCDLSCMVEADERQLRQVLLNLLSNAIKFSDPGGSAGIDLMSDQAAGHARIVVWDTGIGIQQDDQGKLFQPFVQLDSGLSRKYEGTGLGLALSAKLVELNGGSIIVESEGIPGKGSRFIVKLPLIVGGTYTATQSQAQDGAFTVSAADEICVLVVEDNPANLEMMMGFIDQIGYKVQSAEDGRQAVTLAGREEFDLILMDIQLPVMDGLEAIRRIRRDGKNMATPIISLTALAMPGDEERCLAAGADVYISKPVNLRSLLEIMKEILEN